VNFTQAFAPPGQVDDIVVEVDPAEVFTSPLNAGICDAVSELLAWTALPKIVEPIFTKQ
jgi:hypothetical protein